MGWDRWKNGKLVELKLNWIGWRNMKQIMNSTYSAVFSRSVGVTARTLSTHPAAIPAVIPRPAESLPLLSARRFLIASKVMKRTEALNAVPLSKGQLRSPYLLSEGVTYDHKSRASGVKLEQD